MADWKITVSANYSSLSLLQSYTHHTKTGLVIWVGASKILLFVSEKRGVVLRDGSTYGW